MRCGEEVLPPNQLIVARNETFDGLSSLYGFYWKTNDAFFHSHRREVCVDNIWGWFGQLTALQKS